jgi:hypothetical protein
VGWYQHRNRRTARGCKERPIAQKDRSRRLYRKGRRRKSKGSSGKFQQVVEKWSKHGKLSGREN